MRITRRHLQLSLAMLWLLDGALQCQPYMFRGNFARAILAPAGMGQPTVVAAPVHWAAALVVAHPALANGGFAAVQIGLGLALLSRRLARVALAASIAWAIGVWFIGEGLGGVASGATLLAGAPGAALLYGVIAALAWPSREHSANERPSRFAIFAWCALWLAGAGLQLVAGNNTGASVTGTLRTAQTGSPGWIAGIDRHLEMLHISNGAVAVGIAAYVLVALWALVPGRTRSLSVIVGVVFAMVGWLLLQGLGDLTSGHATDPNSGPLIALLALAVVGATRPPITGQHLTEVVSS
jgi:hypothetical protein